MARDGATFREILSHYFPNTIIGEQLGSSAC
jgi:peptidoglycan hydrolase-like amidase